MESWTPDAIRAALADAGMKVIRVGASPPVQPAAAETVLEASASVRPVMQGQAAGHVCL
jgi:methylmalonyl-CoA mutase cobalamin-binding subunit